MAKNQKFETILDECLEQLLTGNGTIEQCLQRYPEYANELEPLLSTALSVNQAVDIKPNPEFKARAHYQLQLKMAETKSPARVSFWRLQPKWALAAASLMLVFVFGGGTVLAADSSMPGNVLYPVKLATENLSVKLADSDIKKGELLAAFTNRRVNELVYLVDNGKTKYVKLVANEFDKNMSEINNLSLDNNPGVLTAMAAAGATAPVTENSTTTTDNETTNVPSAKNPPMLMAGAQRTQATGNENDKEKLQTSKSTTEAPTVSVLSDKDILTQYITYNSIKQPEKLQELLDKVPESYKPLIRSMINDSIQNNQLTLKKLHK